MTKDSTPTSVAVFCASSAGSTDTHEKKSYELGQYLAQSNMHVFYGGGQSGNMGALMNGATAHNGFMTALIPDVYYNKDEKFHQNIKNYLTIMKN